MPVSVGYASPGKHVAVLVTIEETTAAETTYFVTPKVIDPNQAAYGFDKVGKIVFQGQPYDANVGIKVPAYAKYFSFELVLKQASEIEQGAPIALSYVFNITPTEPLASFGLVVDLSVQP